MEISMFLSDGVWNKMLTLAPVQVVLEIGLENSAGNWALLNHIEFNSKQVRIPSCRTDALVIYSEFNACWNVAWV